MRRRSVSISSLWSTTSTTGTGGSGPPSWGPLRGAPRDRFWWKKTGKPRSFPGKKDGKPWKSPRRNIDSAGFSNENQQEFLWNAWGMEHLQLSGQNLNAWSSKPTKRGSFLRGGTDKIQQPTLPNLTWGRASPSSGLVRYRTSNCRDSFRERSTLAGMYLVAPSNNFLRGTKVAEGCWSPNTRVEKRGSIHFWRIQKLLTTSSFALSLATTICLKNERKLHQANCCPKWSPKLDLLPNA